MSRWQERSARAAVASLVLVAAFGLVAWGQHKGLPNADTASEQRAAERTSVREVARPDQPEDENPKANPLGTTYRGELKHPIEYYLNSADIFESDISGQGWHGYRHARKCKKSDPACTTPKSGEMVIQAIEDAHAIPVALPTTMGNGVVIGRLFNSGSAEDETFGIKGKRAAQVVADRYYFIVEPNPNSKTVSILKIAHVAFDDAGKALPTLQIDTARYGFVSCGHPPVPGRTKGIGDFGSCKNPPMHPFMGPTMSDSLHLHPWIDVLDGTAWFSCLDGCCSAQWPPSG